MIGGRRTRDGRLAWRGVGSALVLLALVVLPPVCLASSVGWPLPRSMPSWSAVADALRGNSVSDTGLLRILACASWIVWALMVASVLVEIVAWARWREARRLPAAGLFQPVIRELVMSAALLVSALRPNASTAAEAPRSMTVAAAVLPAAAAPAASARPTCVVVRRDSLWRLAERHLGDGYRWREIWELNRSAEMAGGRHFTDPDLILPGWTLVLPDDATGLESAPPVAPTVQPVPPSVIVPTTTALPPPPRGPADQAPSGAVAPSGAPVTTGTEAAKAQAPARDHKDPDYDPAPLLASAAMVAAGVIAVLTRLRRRQQRHSRPGRMIRLPKGEASRTEVHLRRAAAGAPRDRLDLVLRALAQCLGRRRPGPAPVISVLSVGPEAIEVVLQDGVDAPPGPFDVSAGGRAWTLPAAVTDDALRPAAEEQSAPAPALVVVGNVDDRTVLVDLEAGSRTLVGGDPDDARALLWSMAVDLATSNRADDIDLVLVGKPPAGLEVLDRVRVADSVAEVPATVEATAKETTKELTRRRRSATLDARVHDPALIITPTVVLVADAPGSELEPLLALASECHGLAVVATGVELEAEFDRELCVEEDTLVLKPLGLRLQPASLPADVVEHVGELLETAVDLRPGEAIDLAPARHPPYEGLTIGPDHAPLTFDAQGRPVVPSGHVLVRVLGGVEVVGAEQEIDRRRSVELIVYLAFHPQGVDEGRIKAALWPEGRPSRGTFNETVSRARRLLGDDPTGEHHLRPVDNRRYRLGAYVTTDVDLVVAGGAQAACLACGLPFEGTTRGYEWAHQEGVAYRASALVDSVAWRTV